MRKLFRALLVVAVLQQSFSFILLRPLQVNAQTALTTTALSAAVSQTATTINVVSATGFTASTGTATYYVYVNREAMLIRAVSGTVITVSRGQLGTNANSHRSGTLAIVGAAERFISQDPSPGSCTRATSQLYTPLVSVGTGNIWDCSTLLTSAQESAAAGVAAPSAGVWQATNFIGMASSVPYKNPGNAAYSALLSDYFIDYNTLTAGRTVTLPALTDARGKIYMIRNSTDPGGNAVTVVPSAGQYILTIGTTTTTVGPSLTVKFISVGGGWVTF